MVFFAWFDAEDTRVATWSVGVAESKFAEEFWDVLFRFLIKSTVSTGKKRVLLFNTYVKVPPCRISTPVGVLLAKCDEFFGEALRFLSFWPSGSDGFVFEEGGY